MRRTRRAFTLVEISVAIGIFSLVVYILAAATSLLKMYVLSDQLSHAVLDALVLTGHLEEDLRQVVRDPQTGAAMVATNESAGSSIRFFKACFVEKLQGFTVVPVRWTLKEDPRTKTGYLVRTAYDGAASRWETTRYQWVPLPVPGPDAPRDANPFGLRVEGDTAGPVQTILVTVLARTRQVTGPGAGQDRVTVQVTAAVPPLATYATRLFRPLKRLDEIPADS